jgi:hypothetical protein
MALSVLIYLQLHGWFSVWDCNILKFNSHIGVIHEHLLLQWKTHTWHFDTGNTMKTWLVIALSNTVAVITWDLGIYEWAGTWCISILHASCSMICLGDIDEKLKCVSTVTWKCANQSVVPNTELICLFCFIHMCYISCSSQSSLFYPIYSHRCFVYVTLNYGKYFKNWYLSYFQSLIFLLQFQYH